MRNMAAHYPIPVFEPVRDPGLCISRPILEDPPEKIAEDLAATFNPAFRDDEISAAVAAEMDAADTAKGLGAIAL